MPSPLSPPLLLLSLLLLSCFHSLIVSAQSGFDFSSGQLKSKSLTSLQHASVDDSSGTLTLDASSGTDAQAFYSDPISVLDTSGKSVLNFATFFTFASNTTAGNGTIVFALMPDVTGGLTEARKTLTIEFNNSCSAGGPYGGGFYGGGGFQGRGYWGGGGGGFGGFGGFQVIEYANGTSISDQIVSGYGPGWGSGQPPQGPYFCAQNLSDPSFQYQVAIEYNASTDTIWVGSPSCGAAFARTTQFASQNLFGVITKPVYVGLFASGGAVFNITQWNFTSNTNSSTVANLLLSSAVSTTPGSDGGRGHSSGLKKGYVIAFSILGAAIGVAAVLLVCCLCARRRRVTSARFVGKSVSAGTIPESAVVFDARKPHAAPAKVVLADRDTAPLNTHPNSASTGTASWLQPVAPR